MVFECAGTNLARKLFGDFFVLEAPTPVFARLEGLHDGVFGAVVVLGGVLVFGGVTAADVAAFQAKAEVEPLVAGLEAFFAALGVGLGCGQVLIVGKVGAQHKEDFGAGDEIRTRDIDLGKVALYQLSYSRLGGLTDIL